MKKPLEQKFKFFSHPSQSFIIKLSSNFESAFDIKEDENLSDYEDSLSIYEGNSQRESLSNIGDIETFITPFQTKGDSNEDSILFSNSYSFIQTYLSVLKSSKTITTYPSLLKFSLQVTLRDYTIEEDKFFNYVKYKIEGKINSEPFEVERRYKEITAFRELLVENWPGVLIHPIPPKKSFGNLEDGFINLRKKFLQQFFNKICASPHLASSYETKIFLESRNENFLDLPIEVYIRSVEDIYKIYSNYFNFLLTMTLTSKQKTQVQKFYLTLMKTREKLENLNYVVTEAKNIQMETENLTSSFFENNFLTENSLFDLAKLSEEEKKSLNKSLIEANLTYSMYRTNYDSYYTTFYEWVNDVLMDTNAMLEAISTLYKYNQIFEEKIETLKDKNNELINSASKSFLQRFFFSINLNKIQMRINEVKNLKNEIETYKKIIDLIYKILYYIEIPTFKKDQYSYYKAFVNKIIDNENHAGKKNNSINALIFSHCSKIMEIIGKVEEKE